MRTTHSRISAVTGGRPAARRSWSIYLRAISVRCHASKVSGCHDGPDVRQRTPPQRLGFRSEADALIVGEPEPPRSELLAQDAILLLQIVDDVTLLLVDPAGQRDKQEPNRNRERDHAAGYQSSGRSSSRQRMPAAAREQAGRTCLVHRSSSWTLRGRPLRVAVSVSAATD